MSHMIRKDDLEVLFMEYLGYYYDLSKLECVVVYNSEFRNDV